MIRIATAAAETASSTDAASRCIEHLLAQDIPTPNYLMIQADARHDLATVRTAVQARWPEVHIHAATSCLGSMIETGTHIGRNRACACWPSPIPKATSVPLVAPSNRHRAPPQPLLSVKPCCRRRPSG
jgi:hypothetical protein